MISNLAVTVVIIICVIALFSLVIFFIWKHRFGSKDSIPHSNLDNIMPESRRRRSGHLADIERAQRFRERARAVAYNHARFMPFRGRTSANRDNEPFTSVEERTQGTHRRGSDDRSSNYTAFSMGAEQLNDV